MARIRPVEVATVRLWGRDVGAVAWNADRGLGEFEYDPAFVRQGIDVAPLVMPLRTGIFSFPSLRHDTFHSLPGLLADSLPDRFGNRIIDTWLARQGRRPEEFTPVERVCYMGIRGMGALEFRPAIGPATRKSVPFEVAELTELVRDILRHRSEWVVNLKGDRADALNTIIRIGTSAAGNRGVFFEGDRMTKKEISRRAGWNVLPVHVPTVGSPTAFRIQTLETVKTAGPA